jgi:hypothetical protein
VADRCPLQVREIIRLRRVVRRRARRARRGLDQLHPAADEIARRQRLALLGIGADAAATGVPEHDDMFDAQRLDREFQRRGNRALCAVGRIGRHEIGDVPDHEQLAGSGVENDLRRYAAVAAADHHGFRLLPLIGQFAKAVLLGRQPRRKKGPITLDQPCGKSHSRSFAVRTMERNRVVPVKRVAPAFLARARPGG